MLPLPGITGGDLGMEEISSERHREIMDEVDDWIDEFAGSEQFQRLTREEQRNTEFLVGSFATAMLTHEQAPPKEWTRDEARRSMVLVLPDKIRREPEFFRSVAPVLDAFFKFADERGFIDNGDRLAETARSAADEVVEKAADFRQRGMDGPGPAPPPSKVDVSAEGEPEELVDLREDLDPEEIAKVREKLERWREKDPVS